MLNMTDTRGRTVWIADNRREFDPYLAGFRERGETYRIVQRQVSAMNGTSLIWVLVLTGLAKGRAS